MKGRIEKKKKKRKNRTWTKLSSFTDSKSNMDLFPFFSFSSWYAQKENLKVTPLRVKVSDYIRG